MYSSRNPVAEPFHRPDKQGHIVEPVDVPHMLAYAIVELVTYTTATAEGGPTAQLVDATAWVPKLMRRLLR